MKNVRLIGLDFGSTTSSAVIASAELAHNSVTGRANWQTYERITGPKLFSLRSTTAASTSIDWRTISTNG